MRIATIVPLLALLGTTARADVPDPRLALAEAVRQRQETVDGSTKAGRRAYRALVAAEEHLAREALTLGDELKGIGKCAGKLEKRFPADQEFTPLVDTVVSDLSARAVADRAAAESWRAVLEAKRDLRTLEHALAGFDRKAGRAERATRASARALRLRAAWNEIARAERKLGFGPKPDFALADVNPSSSSFGRTVTPRDFLGKVSAYYFGYST